MPKTRSKGRVIVGALSFLTIFLLVCVVTVAVLIHSSQSDNRWEQRLYRDGPWGTPSIWISEDGDIWIISEEREDSSSEIRCSTRIFMKTESGWDEVSMNIQKWDRSVMVGTYEKIPLGAIPDGAVSDNEIFTCNISVKAGKMVLEEFSETGIREFVNGRERITLTQYIYTDKITQLPFEYTSE